MAWDWASLWERLAGSFDGNSINPGQFIGAFNPTLQAETARNRANRGIQQTVDQGSLLNLIKGNEQMSQGVPTNYRGLSAFTPQDFERFDRAAGTLDQQNRTPAVNALNMSQAGNLNANAGATSEATRQSADAWKSLSKTIPGTDLPWHMWQSYMQKSMLPYQQNQMGAITQGQQINNNATQEANDYRTIMGAPEAEVASNIEMARLAPRIAAVNSASKMQGQMSMSDNVPAAMDFLGIPQPAGPDQSMTPGGQWMKVANQLLGKGGSSPAANAPNTGTPPSQPSRGNGSGIFGGLMDLITGNGLSGQTQQQPQEPSKVSVAPTPGMTGLDQSAGFKVPKTSQGTSYFNRLMTGTPGQSAANLSDKFDNFINTFQNPFGRTDEMNQTIPPAQFIPKNQPGLPYQQTDIAPRFQTSVIPVQGMQNLDPSAAFVIPQRTPMQRNLNLVNPPPPELEQNNQIPRRDQFPSQQKKEEKKKSEGKQLLPLSFLQPGNINFGPEGGSKAGEHLKQSQEYIKQLVMALLQQNGMRA